MDAGFAGERVDLHTCVPLGGEQEQRRELVVETASAAGEDEDSPGPQVDRDVQRQLEIGRILLGRMTVDAYAGSLRGCDGLGRRRVEVPDGDGYLEAQSPSVLQASIGADHDRARRH